MPKVCESCRHYSANDADTVCPACSAPLRFTLLPPSAPAGGTPPRPFGEGSAVAATHTGSGALDFLTATPLGLCVLGVIALALFGGLWEWAKNDPTGESDSTGRIRVGMLMSDVARVIEPEAREAGVPHLADDFPPGNSRTGDLEWREDGRWVRVTFVRGYVTGVREEPAGLSGFGNAGRRVQMRLD